MTKHFIAIPLFFIFSCGSDDSNDDAFTTDDYEETDAVSEFEEGMNDLLEEANAKADSSLNASKVAFVPYADVERYNNPDKNDFETYSYNGVFDFQFPIEPEFEAMVKSDHNTYSISKVSQGTIYSVVVDDYTEYEEKGIVDAGFTNYIHQSKREFMSGESLHSDLLKTDEDVSGYYTCYTYTMEHTYMVDYVTFGFNDYLVHLTVTSRPNCESTLRVTDFIEAFRIL